jgi:hypothetical protein
VNFVLSRIYRVVNFESQAGRIRRAEIRLRHYGDRKKAGEIVEIVLNQKDGRQIAPSRSPLKDLSVLREGWRQPAVSDGYGKSDAHLPRFFSVSPTHVGSWLPGCDLRCVELSFFDFVYQLVSAQRCFRILESLEP